MFMWSLLYDKNYNVIKTWKLLFGSCIYNLDRLQWTNIKCEDIIYVMFMNCN